MNGATVNVLSLNSWADLFMEFLDRCIAPRPRRTGALPSQDVAASVSLVFGILACPRSDHHDLSTRMWRVWGRVSWWVGGREEVDALGGPDDRPRGGVGRSSQAGTPVPPTGRGRLCHRSKANRDRRPGPMTPVEGLARSHEPCPHPGPLPGGRGSEECHSGRRLDRVRQFRDGGCVGASGNAVLCGIGVAVPKSGQRPIVGSGHLYVQPRINDYQRTSTNVWKDEMRLVSSESLAY
jgi:hypothetical protein